VQIILLLVKVYACQKIRKVAGTIMENNNMVSMTKKCPYCGATSLNRRIRKGGYL